MKDDDRDKLVRDFVRWVELRTEDVHATPTVRVPGPPRLPRESIEELAKEIRVELAREDVEDTGIHRIEVIARAVERSQKPPSTAHHSEFDWWKKKQIDVLLTIIATLVAALGFLAWKLIEQKSEPREPARLEERRP